MPKQVKVADKIQFEVERVSAEGEERAAFGR